KGGAHARNADSVGRKVDRSCGIRCEGVSTHYCLGPGIRPAAPRLTLRLLLYVGQMRVDIDDSRNRRVPGQIDSAVGQARTLSILSQAVVMQVRLDFLAVSDRAEAVRSG